MRKEETETESDKQINHKTSNEAARND